MSLTVEQIDQEIIRAAAMTKDAQKLDSDADKSFKCMFVFLIIGIVFLPCLVVALICFALYKYGKSQVNEIMNEVHRIEAVPEIRERIEFLVAEQQAQA